MRIEDPIILIVDDSTNDVLLMRTVFRRIGLTRPLQFAVGGDDAIAYLQGDGRYRDRALFPLPTVVLMDLNMPGRNGFEILEWIRRQPALKRLRVYILSASSRPEDIARAYELGAGSYLVKPRNLDGLVRMAKCLVAWLKLSHFAPLPELAAAPELPAAGALRAERPGALRIG
jgi:CheY-like chemotaxis protein